MDQAVFVGVLQPNRRLPHQFTGVRHLDSATRSEQTRKVESLDILHHQHWIAVDLAGVVGANDMGMFESPDRFHFTLEASDRAAVVRSAGRQDFQGDDAFEFRLQRPVHMPHSTVAKFLEQAVLAQLVAGMKRTHPIGLVRFPISGQNARAPNRELALRFGRYGVG
jgi:hypothetical protein